MLVDHKRVIIEGWFRISHLRWGLVGRHGLLAAKASRNYIKVTFRHTLIGLCYAFGLTHWFRWLFFTAKLALYHLHTHRFPFALLLILILLLYHLVSFAHWHPIPLLVWQTHCITKTERIWVCPVHLLVFQTNLDISDWLWYLYQLFFLYGIWNLTRYYRRFHVIYIGLVVLWLIKIVASVNWITLWVGSSNTLEVRLEIIGAKLG